MIQIDHIIAHTTAPARLQDLIDDLKLPDGFDVHAPANLAPICGPCNSDKRASDYAEAPRLLRELDRARRLAPDVVKGVHAFDTSNVVGSGLVALLEADLAEPGIREAVDKYAPEVARTLATLGYDVAAEVIADTVEVHDVVEGGLVPVALTARALAAVRTLEQLCGHPAHEALEDGVADLAEAACLRIQDRLDEYADGLGYASSGSAQPTRLRLTMDAVEVSRTDDRMQFAISGSFDGEFVNSYARSTIDGEGVDELEADTAATGRFSVCAAWAITTSTGHYPRFTDIEITDWEQPTTLVWGSRQILTLIRADDNS